MLGEMPADRAFPRRDTAKIRAARSFFKKMSHALLTVGDWWAYKPAIERERRRFWRLLNSL
jgi:hypothetical protein